MVGSDADQVPRSNVRTHHRAAIRHRESGRSEVGREMSKKEKDLLTRQLLEALDRNFQLIKEALEEAGGTYVEALERVEVAYSAWKGLKSPRKPTLPSSDFESAIRKLEDARHNFERMTRANHALAFRSDFTSFVQHGRAVTLALQTTGRRVIGFEEWYAPRQEEMKNDALMRYFNEARIGDFHKGEALLAHETQVVGEIDLVDLNRNAPKPPGTTEITVGPDGPYWIVDGGTRSEHRIPVELPPGIVVQSVRLRNSPATHLGQDLSQATPNTVCKLYLTYLEKLVFEARQAFKGLE